MLTPAAALLSLAADDRRALHPWTNGYPFDVHKVPFSVKQALGHDWILCKLDIFLSNGCMDGIQVGQKVLFGQLESRT